MLVAGVDLGTQSLKVLLLDPGDGRVAAVAARPVPSVAGLPDGHSEQDPAAWIGALHEALPEAIARAGAGPGSVAAIGVGAQQHGFVPLDRRGRVIRPAKLWNDVCSTDQCRRLVERAGGPERYRQITGNSLSPGYTAGKVLWLLEHEPERFAELAHVLLPHDYLNFHLTGVLAMEPGDASGTGFFDVRAGSFSEEILSAIDRGLARKIPPLVPPGSVLGTVRPEVATALQLSPATIVTAGGGDNMMAAIGTANVVPGRVTVSLGTSGTAFAFSPTYVADPAGEIAAFRDSTGHFLPLGCTQNVTVATEAARGLFEMDLLPFENLASRVPPGCEGLAFLPFLTGERTPELPHARGVLFGLTPRTFTRGHVARAAMEGATIGLLRLLRRLAELGVRSTEVRLTGGGTRSALWRSIAADVFGRPVIVPVIEESAALGAAIQAAHALSPTTRLQALCDRLVAFDATKTALPDPARSAGIARAIATHERVLASLIPLLQETGP